MGNLLPLAVAAPFPAFGAWRVFSQKASYLEGMAWVALGVAAMWVAVNFLGLFKNDSMKRALHRRMQAILSPGEIPDDPVFVGFARPAYSSAIDPHEDVGFLLLHPEKIEFFGDGRRIELLKKSIVGVQLRPNPHSWAFLGGWVSVEGIVDGAPVRMLFEPREKNTLLGNRALRKALKSRLETWLKS
jgi:hypothetical protein